MRLFLALLLIVGVALYAGSVMLGNNERVDIHLLFISLIDIPLWQGLAASFVLGAFLAGSACSWSILRLRLRSRRHSREIARLEQEVHGLRTLPLQDQASAADAKG